MILNSGYAHASSVSVKSDVLLQINEYNILYTYPKQPYVDKNNRLMVPLRAVSEFLGAEVKYNQTNKKAQITLNNKNLTFTVNSNEVEVNGEIKQTDTTPVIYNNYIFIPIRYLIDYLNLDATLSKTTGILHINSDSVNNSMLITLISESDRATSVNDKYAIQPLSYFLNISNSKSGIQNGSIKVTSKNISGADIEKGKEDLHVVFIYDNAIEMEDDSTQPRERQSLTNNKIFKTEQNFAAPNQKHDLCSWR